MEKDEGNTPSDGAEERAATSSEHSTKAPQTRRTPSAAELEARFDGWRSERREKRQERTAEDDAARSRRLFIGAMGAGVLAIVTGTLVGGNAHQSSAAENRERISVLEEELTLARDAQIPEEVDLAAVIADLSAAAQRDAQRVAAAQQGFAELYHRASTEPDPGNGAPNEATLAIPEHRRELAPLFDEASFLTEEDVYSWTSNEPFATGAQIDPRFEWYVRYDGRTASASDASTWEVSSVMPDLDGSDEGEVPSTATVIWTCRDSASDEVLAWASAVYAYDAAGDTGLFSDLQLVVTTAGAEHRQSSQGGQG